MGCGLFSTSCPETPCQTSKRRGFVEISVFLSGLFLLRPFFLHVLTFSVGKKEELFDQPILDMTFIWEGGNLTKELATPTTFTSVSCYFLFSCQLNEIICFFL